MHKWQLHEAKNKLKQQPEKSLGEFLLTIPKCDELDIKRAIGKARDIELDTNKG